MARFSEVVVVLLALIAIFSGLKQFHVWNQIYWIGCFWFPESGFCPSAPNTIDAAVPAVSTSVGNIVLVLHTLRLIPLAPVMGVGVFAPHYIDLIYSIGCVFLLVVMSRLLARTVVLVVRNEKRSVGRDTSGQGWLATLALLALCGAGWFMNGRLIPALFAEVALLFLYTQVTTGTLSHRHQRLYWIAIVLSALVSSMTILVCGVLSLLWWLKLRVSQQNRGFGLVYGVTVVFGLAVLALPLLKLYQQYDYSIETTLQVVVHHGSGRYLLSIGTFPFVMALSIVLVFWGGAVLRFFRTDQRDISSLMFWTCMLYGFFGYASYALALAPMMQFALMKGHNLLQSYIHSSTP